MINEQVKKERERENGREREGDWKILITRKGKKRASEQDKTMRTREFKSEIKKEWKREKQNNVSPNDLQWHVEGKRAFTRSNFINYKCRFENPFSILFALSII